MPDPKSKNPLMGVFKAPPDPPKAEKPPATADPKAPVATATPPKAPEVQKPSEPPKKEVPGKDGTPPREETPKDSKTPTTPASSKSGEDKKPAEPPKPAEGQKPTDQGKEVKEDKTATPTKSGEDKKPAEPPKPTEGQKPAEPPKPTEGQKPADQGKVDKDGKAAPAPAKAGEDKKPAEQPKPTEGQKPADQGKVDKDGKAASVQAKSGEDKKPAEPPKPTEELDEDGIPKDFSMEIVPKDKLGQVTHLAVSYIDEFEGHPFPVRDDADMEALVKSVKQVGLLEPATVIPNPKKPGRFEMVSGHRRMHAAKLAGMTEIPVIIRKMDHDEATVYMVDSNLKRDIPLTPMEKARAYTMRAEALKRKTGRRSKEEIAALEASGKKPMTADEEIAKQTGESLAQVQRLKTLTKLEPPLQKMVDDKKLPVNTAVDIAQMKPEEQKKLADAMAKEDKVPSGTEAKKLKEESKAGTLTDQKIEAAVAPTKREVEPPLKVTLVEEDLLPYFPKGTLVPDVKKGIFEGLKIRKELMERQKAKAKAEKDGKKPPSGPAR